MSLFFTLLMFALGQPTLAEDGTGWTERELRVASSILITGNQPLPDSYSNSVADNVLAAELGELLFFDARLSRDASVSCASCHQPDKYFTDGRARSVGTGEAMRNSPTVIGASYNRWFYWDGRRDSLWAQALIPFEAPDEMGSTRVAVIRTVMTDSTYSELYESVFGSVQLPLQLDALPEHAGPYGDGDARASWQKLSASDRRALSQVYANIGKTIAAYQRRLQHQPGPFDRYVSRLIADEEIDSTARIPDEAIAGAKLFMNPDRTQCLQCHNGFNLSNGDFHNIGTGSTSGSYLDFGREIGLRAVLMDEFNCLGPFSDAERFQCRELMFLNKDSHLPLRGAFKVPTLRGLKYTAPYFHDGRFEDLRGVLDFYNDPPAIGDVGPHELKPLNLTEEELGQLESFLLSLTD